MTTPLYPDRVVRVSVTPGEWQRLKVLAVERDQQIRELVLTALKTSPVTKVAFQ